MKVNFYVQKYKKDKDDNAPFEVVICANNTRAKFTLDYKVKYYAWDNKEQQFVIEPARLRNLVVEDIKTKRRTSIESEYKVSDIATYGQILKHLEVVKTKLHDSENKLMELGYAIDAKSIKDMFLGKIKGKQYSLTAYYTDFLETKSKRVGKEIVKDTYQKYETALKHFKNFIKKKYRRDDIQLMEINLSMVEAFFSYLLNDVPMSNDSAVGYMKKLKAVLSQAHHDRVIESNPMYNFRTHLEPKDIIFLTKDELSTIYRKEIENERLEKVRDVFVFACLTALSFADQKAFDTKKHLTKDELGNLYILKERQKTGIPAIVPLLPDAKGILEKYNYNLPVLSNQKYNTYLKEIQDICNIKTKLHINLCRPTCATLFLNVGVPLLTVSKVLGHAKVKLTEKTYAKLLPKTIIDDVNKATEKLQL